MAKLIEVKMGQEDWERVISAVNYLSARPAILEREQDEADELALIADSIQDVLDGASRWSVPLSRSGAR